MKNLKQSSIILVILVIGVMSYLYLFNGPSVVPEKVVMDSEKTSSQITAAEIDLATSPPLAESTPEVACSISTSISKLPLSWKQEKREEIQAYLLDLHQQNVSTAILTNLLAYWDIVIGYKTRAQYLYFNESMSYDPPHKSSSTKPRFMRAEGVATAHQLNLEKDVNKIVNAYENKVLPHDKWLLNHELYKQPISPISWVMLLVTKELIVIDHTSLYNYIDRLIQSGVKTSLQDLVIATTLEFPIAILSQLQANFNGDLNRSFTYFGDTDTYTLVTLAIEQGTVDAFYYWLAQDIPASVYRYEMNALDVLAKNKNKKFQIEDFKRLMEYHVYPNFESTQNHLAEWLPEELLVRHKARLSFSPDNFSTADKNILSASITNIAKIVEDGINDLNITLPSDKTCRSQLLHKLTHKILSLKTQKIKEIQSNLLEALTPQVSTKQSKEDMIIARIKTLKEQGLSQDEIIAILGADKNMASKDAVNIYWNQVFQEMLKARASKQKPDTKQPQSDSDEEVEKRRALLEEGKLDEYIDDRIAANGADLSDLSAQERLDTKVFYAIITSNKNELLKAVEQGGNLPDELLATIIKNFDVDVIDALYKSGLNIHLMLYENRNAVNVAVDNRKLNLLRYLLSKGVSPKPSEFGYDALDSALQDLVDVSPNLNFVNALIDAGAPIEHSHREFTEGLFDEDQSTYFKLINRHPSLKL